MIFVKDEVCFKLRIRKEMTWKIEIPVCPTGENEEKHTQKK